MGDNLWWAVRLCRFAPGNWYWMFRVCGGFPWTNRCRLSLVAELPDRRQGGEIGGDPGGQARDSEPG